MGQSGVAGHIRRGYAAGEHHGVPGVQLVGQRLQRIPAHAVAHHQQAQIFRAHAPGLHRGPDHGVQALGRAEITGEYQIEPAGISGCQRLIRLRDGIKVLTVLGNHRHPVRVLAGALHQPLFQGRAHGDELVGSLVAHCAGNAAQQAIFHRQYAVQVFRPDVQHVAGEGDAVQLCIHNSREVHQHRAGVVAEHRIVSALQPPQAEQGEKGPAHIIQKDHGPGIALAGDLPGPEHLRALVFLPAGAGVFVAGKPLALGVVGQAAQHVHFQAVLNKALHNIVDAEGLRPEVLAHH